MEYRIKEYGLKTLQSLPKSIQRRILDKLDRIFQSNNALSHAKHLTDYEYGQYRMRIGDYRASFDVLGDVAYFLKFGHRKDFYK